ncbi:WD40 repeat domain-containing protein [Mycolicibacterium sp. S3B2]|uniref:WD40 repeat domain-containing protein n=1 Tax=Mycolicibacterium sp. S3B2 TaxID=3415120 RepID=UPI003C7ACB87
MGVENISDNEFVSWGVDGTIAVWDSSGDECWRSLGHRGGVWGLTPVGNRLASWGVDGRVHLWSRTGQTTNHEAGVVHEASVQGLIAPDEKSIVSWAADGSILFSCIEHDVLVAVRRLTAAHTGCVNGAAQVRDGGLASWGWDGFVRLWSREGQLGKSIDAHCGSIQGVLERTPGLLVTWGWDGAIRSWSLDGSPAGQALDAHKGPVFGVREFGSSLVSFGTDTTLCLWRISSEEIVCADKVEAGQVSAVVPLTAESFAVAYREGRCELWRIEEGRLKRTSECAAHSAAVTGVERLPDSRLISWGDDGRLVFWSDSGDVLSSHQVHRGAVLGARHWGMGTVATWGSDGLVRFIVGRAGAPQAKSEHRGRHQVLVQDDETLICYGDDGRIHKRVGPEWARYGDARAHNGPIRGVRLLDNGRFVSWGWDGTLRFWAADEIAAALAVRAHCGPVWGVQVLSDDRVISWGLDGRLVLCNLDGGEHAVSEAGTHPIWGLIHTRCADLLSWGPDGTLCRWELVGDVPVQAQRIQAHRGGTWGLLDLGSKLISWGEDGEIAFWRRKGIVGGDLTQVRRTLAHRGGVWCATRTNERQLASWGSDGVLRYWSFEGLSIGHCGHTHKGGVNGVLSLVDESQLTWGVDGAIARTTPDGSVVALLGDGGYAHCSPVVGLRKLGNGAVLSWACDGSIKWWDLADHKAPVRSIDLAHRGAVLGVEELAGQVLISWGSDGATHFWDAAPRGSSHPLAIGCQEGLEWLT